MPHASVQELACKTIDAAVLKAEIWHGHVYGAEVPELYVTYLPFWTLQCLRATVNFVLKSQFQTSGWPAVSCRRQRCRKMPTAMLLPSCSTLHEVDRRAMAQARNVQPRMCT